LKDLLFKVAELYYLQTKKISPVVPDACAVSSSALSTNSSVPSPLIARQLQESPVASPPAALSIEKIACLEFLAFMLLSLPGKSYCLQEFIMTRTSSGPPSKGIGSKPKTDKKDLSRQQQRAESLEHQGYIPAAEKVMMTLQQDELGVAAFQAEIACRSERTAELKMMIELFPERRAYYLGLLEAHVESKPPVMPILSSKKRRRQEFIDSDDNEDTAATSSILAEFEIAEL
jgi:hypothetical protein